MKKYPPGFIARVKAAYPDNEDISECLANGLSILGGLICDNEPIFEAFCKTQLGWAEMASLERLKKRIGNGK